ncbi:MAG: hypothetical protein DYH12_31235 [Sorangiineae bacterium PRO1]|nr:hypothetical protein [Sorangiineae bacterium PRO1]
MPDRTLEELWETAPRATERFDPVRVAALPEGARRYLSYAIAPGSLLPSAARLTMHGTIRLKDSWDAFEAEQVIRWDRGFVWRARVKMHGLVVSGFDRLVDGEGMMRWKLFGLIPFVTAEGAEISRSAAGRLHAEACWLPSVLLSDEISWTDLGQRHAGPVVRAHGEETQLDFELDQRGALIACRFPRWGDQGTGKFHYEDFGGWIDERRSFAGLTIPTRMRLGWFFGSERFEEPGGEFFRVGVDRVEYR